MRGEMGSSAGVLSLGDRTADAGDSDEELPEIASTFLLLLRGDVMLPLAL